jgi:hypothetical protein
MEQADVVVQLPSVVASVCMSNPGGALPESDCSQTDTGTHRACGCLDGIKDPIVIRSEHVSGIGEEEGGIMRSLTLVERRN